MALPREIRTHLDNQHFSAVEDAWLSRLEEKPTDCGYFAAVGKALDRAGEGERSRFLLEMVDEHLTDGGEWQARLELLRRAGGLLFDASDLHPQIVRTLDELYGSYPSYAELVDKVGLHRAIDDLPKIWKKAERLAGLLAFDVGSFIQMEGKGAGRVVEVNMALESFMLKLESYPEMRVGFGAAAKLLKPLPPGHILRRKLESPEALEEMRAMAPAELLQAILESYDEPRTGAQVRTDLAGVLDEKRWSSWWTAARKHPQVISAPGKRKAYAWAASSSHAQDAVWQSFEAAAPRRRLELLRQNAGRDGDLKNRMSKTLAEHAADTVGDDPGLACEIWYYLEKYGLVEKAVVWAPEALVMRLSDNELAALAAGVNERVLRERIYRLADQRRPDWAELAARLIWQETEARALDTLADHLARRAPEAFGGILDQLISQPRKNPAAFTWFAERAKDEPEWLERNPPRFLKQLLWSLTAGGAFAPFKSRLHPLCESGGTLPRLLAHLSEEQAGRCAETLDKTHALLDYQRRPLLNALFLRFPSLRQDEEEALYATQEAIDEKREELRRLAEEEIPANRRAIEVAREMGDLRENFEYKSARQRHEYLSARATALDRDLSRVRPIDPSTVSGREVVIGSRVRFEGDGRSRTITILGPWNSKPEEDVLSNESELARTLLGAKIGDEVDLGDGTYRVARIEPYA